jgi:hypothetical protein
VVYETSLKTGAPEGNVPWTPTWATMPLTEIATVGDGAAVVVVGAPAAGGTAVLGTADGVVVVGVLVVVGGTSAPLELAVAGCVVLVSGVVDAVACGVKGFFVVKTLNTMS